MWTLQERGNADAGGFEFGDLRMTAAGRHARLRILRIAELAPPCASASGGRRRSAWLSGPSSFRASSSGLLRVAGVSVSETSY